MTYYRSSVLASVCVAALLCGMPHVSRAETLDQAVAAALAQHPSIDAAQANREAMAEDAREKKSDYYPQLSVEASGGRIYGDNATSRGLSVTRGAGYSGYGEGSVTLTQNIFNGFQTVDRVRAANARRDSADYKIADARDDLALKATIAYLDVLRSREAVARMQDYKATVGSYVTRIEKMVSEGGADAALREQARDIRSQLDSALAGAKGQLQTASATYEELVGHAPEGDMVKPVPPLDMIPGTPQDAVSYARDHHPTLKAAILAEKAVTMDMKAEKGAYYPALNGQLSYLKSDEKDLLGGELVDARALLKMNWNYAVGGALQARVRKMKHQIEQSRAQREDLERQIARRIETAYSDSQTAEEQVRVQAERVKINEDLFKTQTQQFEGAKVNLLQLEQSDNSLFNANLALMTNEYKALSAKYVILASMGKLQNVTSGSASPVPSVHASDTSSAPVVVSSPVDETPAPAAEAHVTSYGTEPGTVSYRDENAAPAPAPVKLREPVTEAPPATKAPEPVRQSAPGTVSPRVEFAPPPAPAIEEPSKPGFAAPGSVSSPADEPPAQPPRSDSSGWGTAPGTMSSPVDESSSSDALSSETLLNAR